MTTHADIQLMGETVTVSYIADPNLGYGRFRLENHGLAAVTATIESVWLEFAGRPQPLSNFFAFDLDREQAMDPAQLRIDREATLTFLVSFPKVAHLPSFGESATVGLRLRINDVELQAESTIRFERRIPNDH